MLSRFFLLFLVTFFSCRFLPSLLSDSPPICPGLPAVLLDISLSWPDSMDMEDYSPTTSIYEPPRHMERIMEDYRLRQIHGE